MDKILVIDDELFLKEEELLRNQIEKISKSKGLETIFSGTWDENDKIWKGIKGRDIIKQDKEKQIKVIFLDMIFLKKSGETQKKQGLDIFKEIKRLAHSAEVIPLTKDRDYPAIYAREFSELGGLLFKFELNEKLLEQLIKYNKNQNYGLNVIPFGTDTDIEIVDKSGRKTIEITIQEGSKLDQFVKPVLIACAKSKDRTAVFWNGHGSAPRRTYYCINEYTDAGIGVPPEVHKWIGKFGDIIVKKSEGSVLPLLRGTGRRTHGKGGFRLLIGSAKIFKK